MALSSVAPLVVFVRAAAEILSSRRCLGLSLAPAAIGLVTFSLCIWLSFSFGFEVSAYLLGVEEGVLHWIARFAYYLSSLLVAGLVSWIAMLLLGSFFLEALTESALRKHGVVPQEQKRSFLSGVIAEVVHLLPPLFLTLFAIVVSFIPPLALLSLTLSAYLVGAELLDIALGLTGQEPSERRVALKSRRLEVLVFGGIFTVTLLVPFAVLFMPQVAHYAAGMRVAGWKR